MGRRRSGVFRYNRVMVQHMTTAFRLRPAAMMATVVVACLLLRLYALAVYGQVRNKEGAPLDFEAVTAETDRLRSEQFSTGGNC